METLQDRVGGSSGDELNERRAMQGSGRKGGGGQGGQKGGGSQGGQKGGGDQSGRKGGGSQGGRKCGGGQGSAEEDE